MKLAHMKLQYIGKPIIKVFEQIKEDNIRVRKLIGVNGEINPYNLKKIT